MIDLSRIFSNSCKKTSQVFLALWVILSSCNITSIFAPSNNDNEDLALIENTTKLLIKKELERVISAKLNFENGFKISKVVANEHLKKTLKSSTDFFTKTGKVEANTERFQFIVNWKKAGNDSTQINVKYIKANERFIRKN